MRWNEKPETFQASRLASLNPLNRLGGNAIAGVKPEGFLELSKGGVPLLLADQRHAEVEMGHGIIRLQMNDLFKLFPCFRDLAGERQLLA